MKKIPTLFKRDFDNKECMAYDEVTEGCEWVSDDSVATEKIDGMCTMWDGEKLWKRREVKEGKKTPENWVKVEDPDPITKKKVGWMPVGDGPEDKWLRECIPDYLITQGTYEAVGPKIQGNPYGYEAHHLIRHGDIVLEDVPTNYEGVKQYLKGCAIEGIVWHHEDGGMVKIKASDFGFKGHLK